MSNSRTPSPLEQRVLLRAATTRDAQMASAVLERAEFLPHACESVADLVHELERGAGALLLAEEVMGADEMAALTAALGQQPPWSDLPMLVLARQGANSRAIAHVMEEFVNVTVIERPMRVAALVSAVRTALRARRRQYEMRNLLEGLREADQRKTEFLATLAHELRNPLAPLGTALALLTRKKPPAEEAVKYYELMARQVEHMVRLVNDLMEVSRITRGKIELHRAPVLLDAVIDDAVEFSRPLLERAGHRLDIEPAGEPLVVSGDAVRLTQVFSNLLNNAAKYTPPGGRIGLTARHEGAQAVIAVSDTGTGLAPEMLKSIFDMFVQVSGTARDAQGGLGIGLTLVRSLVELHGGSVEAASEGLDRGATFTVRLPLSKSMPAAGRRARGSQDNNHASALEATVLVVDDNRDAADSLAELLGSMGASTLVAYGGEEALTLSRDHAVDIAVLDIGMPGMDGCDLARHLRAAPGGGQLKLIALTGWGQRGDRERIAAAGFDHHLLKPLNLPEFMGLL
ncbi:ATP-binding protein [Variovorax sp. KK3]|uniref:hybrid sensor histidine kinase/response regulator n=1 Tax=Variovorax sp. KK3 TaxID=1855728 RepID=UPI00211932A4|nr:ATP-binding protein [Variovorax sp. KK3]